MEIKEYDLVKYNNSICRVMLISDQTVAKLSTHGLVHINSLEFVERAKLPSLSVGDRVIVKPIPPSERSRYTTSWVGNMSDMVNNCNNGETYVISAVDWEDNTCKVGDYWFALYHLEKVEDYDMV